MVSRSPSKHYRSRRGRGAGALARLAAGIVALGLALSLGTACGGSPGSGAVEYSVSAKQNYEKGVKGLKDEDWIAAAKYFSFIKARFPYSKYAVLSELRMADAEFGAEHLLQAIDAYQLFIKFHPTHEMVSNGYAAFRVGEAYFEMLPGDFWLLPPSHEKDQSATKDAHRELSQFVTKYPKSPYAERAAKIVDKAATRLAAHEWYVATFYWDNDKPMGTVLRLRTLLDKYPATGYDVEAMWLLGNAYRRVDMPDRAKQTWEKLVADHPESGRAKQARAALASL